jgi:hypothetical protein
MAVAQMLMVLIHQIEQLRVPASERLSFTSLLDRQDIPAEFLCHYWEQKESAGSLGHLKLVDALGVLKGLSFVTEANNGGYDMHRLVQFMTCKWLTSNGTVS